MNQRIPPATPDEKIVHLVKEWRPLDQAVIADKDNKAKRKAEFVARQKLRHAADLAIQSTAGEP